MIKDLLDFSSLQCHVYQSISTDLKNLPEFDGTLYARRNPANDKDVYRCCEILDVFETGKVYNVMKTKTNIGGCSRFV